MDTIKVTDVAKDLGLSPRLVRKGIEQGVLPFGVCIKGSRNRYLILKNKYEAWKGEESCTLTT